MTKTLGLITDYIDDSAESARKANHHAAAQSATDKHSYMVVVISQVRTRIWTKNFWSIGRYENYGVEFTTKYYELNEYFEMLKE